MFYFANISLDQEDQKLKQHHLPVVGPGDRNMSAYRAQHVAVALPPHTYFFQLVECHLCLCMEQVSLVNSLNKLNFFKKILMSVYTGADIIRENAICTQTHYCLLSALQSEQCQKGTEARWSTVCFAAAAVD